MEKIKNICCDLGRAFTIGLLSGGAAAAVLLLGGFLFGGFTFRAALEAAKDGLLLIAALGMFVIAGMLMVKGKNPEKFTQKEKWRVHFAVLGYETIFTSDIRVCSQFSAFPGCCGRQRRIIFCIGCENSFYK